MNWEHPETAPRTLDGAVRLREARERLARGVEVPVAAGRRWWIWWAVLALPVVVAVVWRCVC